MSKGAAFSGLISGLNEGISTTRARNQREAELEIQAEQDILNHLAKTSENKAVRDAAISGMLNIHNSGKPTGFLGKLVGKRSENQDITNLFHAVHPSESAGAPPSPEVSAAAPEVSPQPPVAPPDISFGGMSQDPNAPPAAPNLSAPSIAPLPSSPAGPAALPINTTKQQTPISFTPPPVAAAPPPAPPSGSVAPPPGPDSAYGAFGVPSPLQTQAALASSRAAAPVQEYIAALRLTNPDITDQELNDAIVQRFGGSGMRSAQVVQTKRLNELTSLPSRTPAQEQELKDLRQILKLDTTNAQADKNKFTLERDARLAKAKEEAGDKTLAGQLRIAEMRIAAARANHQESVALSLEKELRAAKKSFATLKPAEISTLDNIQFAKPAIEDVKSILEESGLKNDNSVAALANTRLHSFLYTHGLNEDVWSPLQQKIAFLNLPTARQYMQGRPSEKIYTDIMAHLPNPKVDTGKQMYDKLENIEKFSKDIEEGISKSVQNRVNQGLELSGFSGSSSTTGKAASSPPSSDDEAIKAFLAKKNKH